jgi:S1-C subfamily serine protease
VSVRGALHGIVVLACLLDSAAALAAEGFFADALPPAVRTAWPSVYAFVCESRKSTYVATAFFVAKTSHGKRADYFFVTAGHAVDDCRHPRRYLVEDINQPRFEPDGITVARHPRRLDGVTVVDVDDAYDLAIVKVEAKANLRIGNPIPVDDRCYRALHREIYAIGFPGVGKRRSLRLKRDVKRWSKGEFVGLGRTVFRRTLSTYIASTVDSLPGNSGGPVVDETGALVGVVAQGAAGDDNKYRYDVDPRKKDDWQTFLAPCDAVVRMLGRAKLVAQ